MKKFFLFIWELVQIVAISLAVVLPVRYYIAQPFIVQGASMKPNFFDGEYLVINEIGYRFESPQRGEVIVFKYPYDPSQYFIKRIIGLPGETVEVKAGKVVIYNDEYSKGFILNENAYLDEDIYIEGDMKVLLKDDEYFMLGDNRDASSDSRRWGPLKKSFIIGKVWMRAWPVEKFKIFD